MARQRKDLSEKLDPSLSLVTSDAQEDFTALQDLPKEYRFEIEKGISTGWRCLDLYLQGVREGEVTVITADTGCGKTTFCIHLIVNCALQGAPCWVNSWEMKPQTTMRKIASIVLGSPMKVRPFTEEESKKFDEWGKQHRVHLNRSMAATNLDTLASKLEIAHKMGIKVVMLDHLDYLVNPSKDKLHEAIDETVKRLHELAFQLSMHFFLICHPRQSNTGSEEIGMHALKGSSSIKQYADNILTLHRCARTDPQSAPNKVKIRVCKNRLFGTEGTTFLYYNSIWDGYEQLHEGI